MNDSRSSLTDNPFGRLLGVLVSPVATFRREGRFMASNLAYFAPEETPLPLGGGGVG